MTSAPRSAFHLAVGELSGTDAFLITSRLFDHLFIHTFANELFSCPAFGGGFLEEREGAQIHARALVSSESLSNHSGAVETAEVGTWSVGPRWERRRSERVREVRVLVDQSGDEPLLSSRCVSEERFFTWQMIPAP